jgi:hypothetical protein
MDHNLTELKEYSDYAFKKFNSDCWENKLEVD